MMQPRFLILGASGYIGRRLLSRLGRSALGTWCRTPLAGGIPFDAARERLAEAVLGKHRGFSHAFLLHGVTSIDACARDPQGSARVNVEGTVQAIDDLAAAGIVPVFASSDAVFDGTRGGWSEDDPPNPVLTYGRQKLEVERYLAASGSGIVVRLAKVVEPMLEDWMSRLEGGLEIRCATDQVLSPVAVEDAVSALIALAEDGHAGTFHLSGPRALTRLDLLEMLVEEARMRRRILPRIVPCSLRDFDFAEPRPLDCSMASDKLRRALGLQFEDMRSACRRVAGSGALPAVAVRGG